MILMIEEACNKEMNMMTMVETDTKMVHILGTEMTDLNTAVPRIESMRNILRNCGYIPEVKREVQAVTINMNRRNTLKKSQALGRIQALYGNNQNPNQKHH